MRIIYATSNEDKKTQIEEFLKSQQINDIEFLTLKDIGFNKEIIEDGSTFEENSMKKAKEVKHFCEKNNIHDIVLGDDAGLCVNCLNGEPGVYSGRYAGINGQNGTQEANIRKLLTNIDKTGDKERKAKFVCVLTAIFPNGKIKQVRGECLGHIAKTPGLMGKLTYGPVFIPEGSEKVMNEMKPEELGKTHREKAFLELLKLI